MPTSGSAAGGVNPAFVLGLPGQWAAVVSVSAVLARRGAVPGLDVCFSDAAAGTGSGVDHPSS